VKSLHKVLNIIDTVASARSAGIRELSSLTGFSPATVHRIVSTLVGKRYFIQDPATGAWFMYTTWSDEMDVQYVVGWRIEGPLLD